MNIDYYLKKFEGQEGHVSVEDLYKKDGNIRIKRIISQSRRDFVADYECEHWG